MVYLLESLVGLELVLVSVVLARTRLAKKDLYCLRQMILMQKNWVHLMMQFVASVQFFQEASFEVDNLRLKTRPCPNWIRSKGLIGLP